jgi:ParB-like chromosome segregation protein Spo0J
MKKHSAIQPSSVIEVPLSAVKPNPFRQLEKFPLDETRLAVLRKSIQRTDFWGNIVCRKQVIPAQAGIQKGEFFELAYGHHRLEALRRELGAKAKVRMLCREIDDETMLKMMAADNDDAYNLSPGFILETVEAAGKFITRDKKLGNTHLVIAKFLAWPIARVQHALAQLGAIEREELSREAVKKLHSQREAIALHAEVQERKKRKEKVSHKAQEAAAERVADRGKDKRPAELAVHQEIDREVHPLPVPADEKIEQFGTLIYRLMELGGRFSSGLDEVARLKEDLTSEVYSKITEVQALAITCDAIRTKSIQLFGEVKHGNGENQPPRGISAHEGRKGLPN